MSIIEKLKKMTEGDNTPNVNIERRTTMKGKVKWFNPKKGYGFITSEDGEDIFVHQSAIKMDGFRYLKPKQDVEFETEASDKGTVAVNVTVL